MKNEGNVEACKRWIVVCAEHKWKRHYVPRRKPACAKVSEEKRRTVWAVGEFSTFSERAHPAGRLGASSLDLFCLLFCVKTKERLSESKSKLVCILPNVSSFGKKVSGFGQRPRETFNTRTTSGQSQGLPLHFCAPHKPRPPTPNTNHSITHKP